MTPLGAQLMTQELHLKLWHYFHDHHDNLIMFIVQVTDVLCNETFFLRQWRWYNYIISLGVAFIRAILMFSREALGYGAGRLLALPTNNRMALCSVFPTDSGYRKKVNNKNDTYSQSNRHFGIILLDYDKLSCFWTTLKTFLHLWNK
jgi:hypothetical protein